MSPRSVLRSLRGAGARPVRRVVADAWPLLQGTAAATAAWLIAKHVLDHPEPFFAPIAALVALNTSLGERGRNALRLLQGVIVGIAVGEVTLLSFGGGYGALAIAILAATVIARAFTDARVAVAQAAVSAILVVALADADAGLDRLIDALVGAGVALVFSQLLFSPEPLRLLRRAETAALAVMADGLSSTAEALDRDEDELAEKAIGRLRELRDDLSELGRVRRASTRVARRSLAWRSRLEPVVQEKENAGHLDLLGSSCLVLARTSASLDSDDRAKLAPHVRELAEALIELADGLGARTVRQRAADRALAVAAEITPQDEPPASAFAAAVVSVRLVATDVMVFAGIDRDDAVAVVRKVESQGVPDPPEPAGMPFSWLRWLQMPLSRMRSRRGEEGDEGGADVAVRQSDRTRADHRESIDYDRAAVSAPVPQAVDVFERIVCGVDGTLEGLVAVEQAARLAQGRTLRIVTAADVGKATHAGFAASHATDVMEREAQDALAEARSVAPDADATVVHGDPVTVLLREAADATLLAVGSHGRGRAAGMFLGTVAARILRDAPCSVLIARAARERTTWPASVVVGVDGSSASAAAFAAGKAAAEKFGASLRAIASTRDQVDLEAARGIAPELEEQSGRAVDVLAAATERSDLLVLGSRGLHGLKALGSVSERAAYAARSSVLVVRSGLA